MTATDELRRLLDEHGVEYVLNDEYAEKYPPEQEITWSCDIAGEDMTITARDYFIGDGKYCLDLEFHEVFTTEQAIAATLGPGTCRNNAPTYLDFLCSECGFVHYHSDANDTKDGNGWGYCPNCGRRVVEVGE